jgi:hypothetical protein
VVECRNAPCDPLNPLEVLNWTHLGDGCNLLWVGSVAALGNDETEKHSPGNPKNAFLEVESDVVRSESGEGLL